jgi:hypothetical protein
MRKFYTIIILFTGVFILNACNKDTDIFVPDAGQITGPDSTWYSTVTASMPVNDLEQSLLLPPDVDSIEVNSIADTIHSASGLNCIFPPFSCVDSNGAEINGKVYVESYLLKKKGDLISMGLPTISNGNLLVSGGVFSVKMKQGNSYLKLSSNAQLNVSYNDTLISQQMGLFYNSTTNDGQLNWIPGNDSSNFVIAGNNGYDLTCNNLQWINCDYFYGDTTNTNKTIISVKLPADFTNANTVAYIVFNDIRSVMAMQGDAGTKQFITNKVPIGLNATIVVFSKQGNLYYLGQQTMATTTNNQLITITPAKVYISDIKAYLSSL